jgi:hypothetical protein
MKFMALIYTGETDWAALPDDARSAMYERYRAFGEAARAKGAFVAGDELAPTSTATTVRVRDGETIVTDGPFVETKEALGGCYVLECATFDEALDLASQIPATEYGAVEVRPCHVDEAAEQAQASEEVVA